MTTPVTPDPQRLRRSARNFLIWGIVFWALFALFLLGQLASALRPVQTGFEGNAAYAAGRIIGVLLFLGVPLVLAIVFTVKQNTLRKRAIAIESGGRPVA